MKCLSLVGSLLFSFAVAACAQQSATPPPGKASGQHDTSKDFSLVRVGKTCQFRIRTTAGEHYSSAAGGSYMFYDAKPSAWGFPIRCYAGASQDTIAGQLGANQVDGQWISEDFNAPFTSAQHFQTYTLTGKNWSGRVTAYDQTTGDEDTRQRFFLFCLVQMHGPQVLCGQVQGLTIDTVNTADKIKKVLAVLKTIEFVDTQATPANSSSNAPGH